MFIWTFAGLFMGVYNIGLNVALALWIQPQLFTFIALICLMQEFRYQHQWSKTKTAAGFVVCCLVIGALEAGFIFAFRVKYIYIFFKDEKKNRSPLHDFNFFLCNLFNF